MSRASTILINSDSVLEIFNEMNRCFPLETGGVLTGYRVGNNYMLSNIVGPGPKAIHKSNSFIPDYEYHEKEVARIFFKSKMQQIYLGDWHTHPNAKAYLSKRDKKTLYNIAHSAEAKIKEPLMLVFGTNPIELAGWKLKSNILRHIINKVPIEFVK